MVSTLPTFSLKNLLMTEGYQIFGLVALGLLIAALFSAPWQTLTAMALAYMATLPVSYRRYRRQARAAAETGTPTEGPLVYEAPEEEGAIDELGTTEDRKNVD